MWFTFKQPWRSQMQVTKVKQGWSRRPIEKKTVWCWSIYDPSSSHHHIKPLHPVGVAPWQDPKHVAVGRPCSSYWFPSRDPLLPSWVSRLNYTARVSSLDSLACFTSFIQESLGKLAFKDHWKPVVSLQFCNQWDIQKSSKKPVVATEGAKAKSQLFFPFCHEHIG